MRIVPSLSAFQAGAAVAVLALGAAVNPVEAKAEPVYAPALVWATGEPVEAPEAAAVGAAPTPRQLLEYLVQGIAAGIAGIARGAVVVVGTTVYVSVAFTGGLIMAVGDSLPGPVGDYVVDFGSAVLNLANVIAEVLRVGPYGTMA